MENEEGRKEYLVFPASKNQCPNQKGRKIPLKGNGRRIDYILYKEEGLHPDWKVVSSDLHSALHTKAALSHAPFNPDPLQFSKFRRLVEIHLTLIASLVNFQLDRNVVLPLFWLSAEEQ